MKTVPEIMSREVVTVTVTTPIRELARTLSRRRISAVPVVDENQKPIGVVSTSDLTRLAARTEGGHLQPADLEFYRPGRLAADLPEATEVDDLTAGELMNRIIVSVEEETPLAELMNLMLSFRIHRVLVTSKGRLSGLVSSLDVVRAFRDHLQRCPGVEMAPPALAADLGDLGDELELQPDL